MHFHDIYLGQWCFNSHDNNGRLLKEKIAPKKQSLPFRTLLPEGFHTNKMAESQHSISVLLNMCFRGDYL